PNTQASTAVGSSATGSSNPLGTGKFVSPSPTPQTTCANTPLTTLWEDSTTGPEGQSRADSRLRTSSPSASPFVACSSCLSGRSRELRGGGGAADRPVLPPVRES